MVGCKNFFHLLKWSKSLRATPVDSSRQTVNLGKYSNNLVSWEHFLGKRS